MLLPFGGGVEAGIGVDRPVAGIGGGIIGETGEIIVKIVNKTRLFRNIVTLEGFRSLAAREWRPFLNVVVAQTQ